MAATSRSAMSSAAAFVRGLLRMICLVSHFVGIAPRTPRILKIWFLQEFDKIWFLLHCAIRHRCLGADESTLFTSIGGEKVDRRPVCVCCWVPHSIKNTGGSTSQLATHDELSNVSSCVLLWRCVYARCSLLLLLENAPTEVVWRSPWQRHKLFCRRTFTSSRYMVSSSIVPRPHTRPFGNGGHMAHVWLTCGSRVSGRMFTSAPGVQSHDDRRSSQSLSLTCEETGGTHANTTGAIDRTIGLDLLLFSQFGCPRNLRWESLLRAVAPIDVQLASLQI